MVEFRVEDMVDPNDAPVWFARWSAVAQEPDVTFSLPRPRLHGRVLVLLGANVVQHSGQPSTGYGLADIDSGTRRLEMAFADCGAGFRASLQRNPELSGRISDDAEALQLAMTPRITGTQAPRANMGIGPTQLVEFSDLLQGDLWIASGSAMLRRKTTADQRTNVIYSIPEWRGTWICLDAPVT